MRANELKAAAAGRWRDVARQLGIPDVLLTGQHGPCPKCGGVDRWRVFDDFDRTGGAYCNQCGAKIGDGLALVRWWTGCDFQTAVGRVADILGVQDNSNGRPRIVETYPYTDEAGKLLFEVCRYQPKNFRQRRPDGKGGWTWSVKGVRQVPYRLPELSQRPDCTVFVVEGEKDVDALRALRFVATCNAGGAGKWTGDHSQFLAGRDVIVMPDADEPGRRHGEQVARSLQGVARSVRIVELPDLPDKGDVSDWIAAGGTFDGLVDLSQSAAEWSPTPATDVRTPRPDVATIANCQMVDGDDGKPTTHPLNMADIITTANRVTDQWPRRVAAALFVHAGADVHFIRTEAALFGFYHSQANVHWTKGARYVTKAELFAEIARTATAYDAVELLPHEPRLPGHYYVCGDIPAGDGDHLRQLVDRFAPATNIDHDLILAAFLTPGWGGPAGARPAFCVTSDHGRGIGKTTLAETVGLVWHGVLSFSHHEDIGRIKTRLLTPDAMTRRVALLDNVKSLKFSWSELEAMVTSTTIGGHRMYCGEGTRPNTLTWFVTLNGASLSTDMAQRAVIIKLNRPQRSGSWSDETRAFIETHRPAIIADVVGFLRSEPATLERFTRWSNWERDVLARLPEPSDAQRVIEERQVGVDVEAEEAATIEDFFAGKLRWLQYDADEWVFIPSRVANEWYNAAQNDRLTTSQSTRVMTQMASEGRLTCLRWHRLDQGRGFLWTPNDSGGMVATDLSDRLARCSQ